MSTKPLQLLKLLRGTLELPQRLREFTKYSSRTSKEFRTQRLCNNFSYFWQNVRKVVKFGLC